jgi:predicted kinase
VTGRSVTLVAGPPCAGKTTWVRQHAQPGDLVLDADNIARRLGSTDQWQHAQPHRQAAQDVMWQQMAAVRAMPAGTAWVIRAVPDPAERARLAHWLRATTVVVLLPPAPVLMGRAGRRPHPYRTRQAIRYWASRYRPHPDDQLNPDQLAAR